MQPLFWCQREVWINVMCHPVVSYACRPDIAILGRMLRLLNVSPPSHTIARWRLGIGMMSAI